MIFMFWKKTAWYHKKLRLVWKTDKNWPTGWRAKMMDFGTFTNSFDRFWWSDSVLKSVLSLCSCGKLHYVLYVLLTSWKHHRYHRYVCVFKVAHCLKPNQNESNQQALIGYWWSSTRVWLSGDFIELRKLKSLQVSVMAGIFLHYIN